MRVHVRANNWLLMADDGSGARRFNRSGPTQSSAIRPVPPASISSRLGSIFSTMATQNTVFSGTVTRICLNRGIPTAAFSRFQTCHFHLVWQPTMGKNYGSRTVQEPARELLKVGHLDPHPTSTSQELFAPVHATSAGISFGMDNPFAHSRYRGFERLEEAVVKCPGPIGTDGPGF